MSKENSAFKRLFFAFEIESPWPSHFSSGRLIHEDNRHLTVAFLGESDWSSLRSLLSSIPLPLFPLGLTGKFDQIIFLPSKHPRVAAWHIHWFEGEEEIRRYVRILMSWLKEKSFTPDDRKPWLPHVTLCRSPFDCDQWSRSFHRLPLFIRALHLYESLGELRYQPVWSHFFLPPFEELDHTADLAFEIRGKTVSELFFHALIALSFHYPNMLDFSKKVIVNDIKDIVTDLNAIIAHTDTEIGCPFKAVSFHGEIKEEKELLSWEMIVDV